MPATTPPLRLGVAGLGTVGTATLAVLARHGDLLAQRCGRRVQVAAVSARDRHRERGIDLSGVRWFDDPVALAGDEAVDLVVELIGGSSGIAYDAIETALAAGKHVVTANKALLAQHGNDLAARADRAGVSLAYEAAIAGGVPIVKTLREALAANRFSAVYGILNGTCNFILSQMRDSGREFGEVLAEAQRRGFAEADPSVDVDGIDAGHKLALLTALAFGVRVDWDGLQLKGIRQISALDIEYAEELGYRIKLLGIARTTEEGIEQRVQPCMVPADSPIAGVEQELNAVVVEGDAIGRLVLEGPGAGGGPTASAVLADIVDIARGDRLPSFVLPADELAPARSLALRQHHGPYYLRLLVVDRPGVLAEVAGILHRHDISVEKLIQRDRAPGDFVPVVLTTHRTDEARMTAAIAEIDKLEVVQEPPRILPIEAV